MNEPAERSRWPLGSEVRRTTTKREGMLTDASRAGNFTAEWFDPKWWEAQGGLERTARGRGTAWLVRAGERRMVLRHYRRGGLMASVSRDRYIWRGEAAARPFGEWYLMYHLHRAGLPVPAPVAARYVRRGLVYTGDLITEQIVDAQSLAQRLAVRALSILDWIAVGRCIRKFHDVGVYHADLNAHNVLFARDGSVYLVDFDRSRLRKPGLWRDANLVRLRRSLEKVTWGLPPGRITEADWHGLLDGYRESTGAPRASADAA
jgi:3-deoxy-D-manno-octulosonic acid kinase